MTKTLNQIFFFSSTKIRIFFSATLGIRIFFLEKNHNPPPPPPFKLNGRSLMKLDDIFLTCLYTGETWAVLQSDETIPVVTDLLNDMVRIGSIYIERSFKSFGLISSGPAALDGFKLHISPTFVHSAKLSVSLGVMRDRPFNLQGEVLWFFVSFRNFFLDNTRVRIFFFQNLTLGYMTKTLNQIIPPPPPHQNQNIFFSNIGNQNIFLEK